MHNSLQPSENKAFAWRPLPLGHLLERYGLTHRKTLYILGGWILFLGLCLYTVLQFIPLLQSASASRDFTLISIFAISYPPILFSTLILFWFGFEWGFIPAYLSTFLFAVASGMDPGWALLFGLAVVLGMGIYALTYYSIKMEYTLQSLSSLAIFVGVSFIASMATSLGSLLWCHINEVDINHTIIIWKAWWTGSFLQTIVIIAPLLYLAGPAIERFKEQHFELPERPDLSLAWVYTSILSIVAVLCLFVWANELLGSLRIQETLQKFPHVSRQTILSASQSFELTTWIAILMAVICGLAGIKLVGSWNSALKKQVDHRTRQLHERAQQFRATFEQAAVGLTHMSIDGAFLKVNSKMNEITGRSTENLSQYNYFDLTHEEDLPRDMKHLRLLRRGQRETYMREKRYLSKQGEPIWVNVATSLVRDEHARPSYFISIVEDISDRKAYEHQLEQSLQEKKTLLAEIHHRVKNNLAVVSALLELQMSTSPDPEIQNLLKHAISRIQSMAMVHRLLYESESMENIDLSTYINQLAETVERTFSPENKEINLEMDLQSVKLDADHAVPCGLIMNELIINAYKHAFKDQHSGRIQIQAKYENESTVKLEVSDNGAGIPEDTDILSLNSLGMKLVRQLTKQLNADLDIHNDEGAVFAIRFTPEDRK